MSKAPAFQFYVRDWLSDPLLKMVSHQTKGIWIDLLCYLWESPERGRLVGTPEQFVKMVGCNADEWTQFYNEASVTKFADVTKANGLVTVCNRRMFREDKERKNTRLRVQRYRERQQSNAPSNDDITLPSSSSSSFKEKEIKKEKEDYAELIEQTHHLCQTLSTFFKNKKMVWQWRQQAMNNNIAPELIQECLEQLWKYRATTRDPTAYMNHIIQIKHQNATEAKAIAEHEARKLEFAEIARKIGHNGE